MKIQAISLALLGAVCGETFAATYYVSPCGQDFWAGVQSGCAGPLGAKRTIQAAIDVASSGDVITVMPGVYVGTIDLDGKAIRITGAAGAAGTILDGGGAGPVVRINSFEGPGTIIEGLTIRNGGSAQSGAGMLIGLASPIVRECIFEDNESQLHGGAIASTLSSPQIIDCHFEGNLCGAPPNVTQRTGGAIYLLGGSPVITGCSFTNNSSRGDGGALAIGAGTTAEIDDCVFTANFGAPISGSVGGAIYMTGGEAAFSECLFDSNVAVTRGGAAFIENGATASFAGCDFLENTCASATPRQGGAVVVQLSEASFVGCSFEGNTAGVGCAIRAYESDVSATFCGFHSNSWLNDVFTDGAGGAISSEGGSLALGLCTFIDNEVDGPGGAVALENVDATIQGCIFTGNAAVEPGVGSGGAVWALGGSLVVSGSTFTQNTAEGWGAGVYISEAAAVAEILNCTMEGNTTVDGTGAGLHVYESVAIVEGCDFLGNSANTGGGASTYNAEVRFNQCVFNGNMSSFAGGGTMHNSSDDILEGCAFIGNSAISAGSGTGAGGGAAAFNSSGLHIVGCEFTGNTAGRVGGAIWTTGGAGPVIMGLTSVVNCIIANNTADFGRGTVVASDYYSGPNMLQVANSVIVDNTGGGVVAEILSAPATLSNSIVRSNTSGPEVEGAQLSVFHSNIEGGWAGEGNIDANPMFINAAVGNYRLQPGSPCVDAGVNARVPLDFADIDGDANTSERTPLDYDGNPRFMDDPAAANLGCGAPAIVDMGPFERAGAVAPMLPFADLNGDGVVNASDLAILLGAWGPCMTGCCPGDLNLDGQVNASDLAMLLGAWS